MSRDEPDEIVTLAYCPACQVLSVPADCNHDGEHIRCQRCDEPLSADDFYDYADLRVVDYE